MRTPLPKTTGHFGTDDSAQMIKLLEMEILNRRAKRQAQGSDQRWLVRMFGVLILFILMLVVLGAMWYVQTSQMENRLPQHHPKITTSPAPAASIPVVGLNRAPKPTDH